MASSSPMVNGDISRGPGSQPGHTTDTLEETLQQMNSLIQENRDLKEALRQTNIAMKERFEGLSVWKEKQREERDFLQGRLEEARSRMEALSTHNQELSRRMEELQGGGADGKGQAQAPNQNAELEALRAQVVRLQAEKSDLVAMNSELQLKTGQGSEDDSFIEIRIAREETGNDLRHDLRDPRYDMTASRQESEELTVSQLLQSLRKETQRVERLQIDLQAARARITELEEKETISENSTQTSLEVVSPALDTTAHGSKTEPEENQQNSGKDDKAASEVENLKAQMMTLFKELQQAQSKLDEADGMKKNLQDRCRDVEQEVGTLRAQLVEKQAVQSENDRLKLQLESIQAQILLEQRKAGEDRTNLSQLKEAYTKLFEDYNELKQESKKREPLVTKEEVGDLQTRLDAAEKALAAKQQQIDAMKQEIYQKEEELETISVFQAQAEVYSSDFYAERAAREKIHEEKERLSAQLEFVKKQNTQLQDELESLGRQSLSDMQRRHVSHGGNPQGGDSPHNMQGARGGDARDWQQQGNIPEHACPKCSEILPDLDSLQIHIMDCII
ncbi:optineurin isoform X2 [Esox lucius]|uniref:optineurin isoform X2 n=1 Tax=Esox lucius TaxID=8010 RepID=UPI0014774A60|nr:optineurin isoform X2 [Esox lucius]